MEMSWNSAPCILAGRDRGWDMQSSRGKGNVSYRDSISFHGEKRFFCEQTPPLFHSWVAGMVCSNGTGWGLVHGPLAQKGNASVFPQLCWKVG